MRSGQVFDDLVRTDASHRTYLETSFHFLNRVAGVFWDQVRDLVQSWSDHVQADAYPDIRGRLRSDDAENRAAFFELYLHEMFLRADYRVAIHPGVPTSTNRPDLLVEGHGQQFYVEAVVPGRPSQATAASGRRAASLDTLNSCSNKNFFLSVERLDVGPRPAKGRLLRNGVERWLTQLDPDEVVYDIDRRVQFEWSSDGWEVTLSAIPISPEHRGRSDHRAIGVLADGEVGFIDDAPLLARALTRKARRYGSLGYPLIIAVGTEIWDRDRWHSTNALYGRDAVSWWETDDGTIEHARTRRADGYFGTPPAWRNSGVSAVLHVNQLQPSHVQRTGVTLWPHPRHHGQWRDLSSRTAVNTVRFTGSSLESVEPAVEAAAHLGLPDPWPAGDPFP